MKGNFLFWNGGSSAEVCAGIWRAAMMRLFKLAGVKGHPHMFRHCFAKRLLMANVPIGTVAVLMGHRRVAITEASYSRWIPERQAAVDSVVRNSWNSLGTPEAH